MSKKRGIRVGQAIDFGTYRQGRFSAKLERRVGEVEKEAADYTLEGLAGNPQPKFCPFNSQKVSSQPSIP